MVAPYSTSLLSCVFALQTPKLFSYPVSLKLALQTDFTKQSLQMSTAFIKPEVNSVYV